MMRVLKLVLQLTGLLVVVSMAQHRGIETTDGVELSVIPLQPERGSLTYADDGTLELIDLSVADGPAKDARAQTEGAQEESTQKKEGSVHDKDASAAPEGEPAQKDESEADQDAEKEDPATEKPQENAGAENEETPEEAAQKDDKAHMAQLSKEDSEVGVADPNEDESNRKLRQSATKAAKRILGLLTQKKTMISIRQQDDVKKQDEQNAEVVVQKKGSWMPGAQTATEAKKEQKQISKIEDEDDDGVIALAARTTAREALDSKLKLINAKVPAPDAAAVTVSKTVEEAADAMNNISPTSSTIAAMGIDDVKSENATEAAAVISQANQKADQVMAHAEKFAANLTKAAQKRAQEDSKEAAQEKVQATKKLADATKKEAQACPKLHNKTGAFKH